MIGSGEATGDTAPCEDFVSPTAAGGGHAA